MLNILIFSKDRACQLELLLRSMKHFFKEWKETSISILYTHTNEQYKKGYDKVRNIHPEFDYMIESPNGFKKSTIGAINPNISYTVFFVDDDVFKEPFSIQSDRFKQFIDDPDILCLSLRMHPRISYCYTRDISTPAPVFKSQGLWDWRQPEAKGDWCYPMSVDGHIFRTKDIMPYLETLEYKNPNYLEGQMAGDPLGATYMLCYDQSIIVNIPMNRVQQSNSNRAGDVSLEFLNNKLLNNQIISLSTIEGAEVIAPHQELPVTFESVS